LRESFVGGRKGFFFVLTQNVEGSDQAYMFAIFQRQIEAAQTEERFFVRERQGDCDTFLVNFNAENFQVWIHTPEARGAFEGGTRVKAVAEVNE